MKKNLKGILIVAAIVLLIFGVFNVPVISKVLKLLFISYAIAYILRPLHEFLIYHKIKRKFSALIIILALTGFFVISIRLIFPAIFSEFSNIDKTSQKVINYVDGFNNGLNKINGDKTIYVVLDNINAKVQKESSKFIEKIIDGAMDLAANLTSLFVLPIIVYYFLVDKDSIGNNILICFPLRTREIVRKITRDIDKILNRYIVSQLLLSIFMSIMTFIVLIYLGVDYPVLLSIINGAFNIIPYFGPVLGAIAPVLLGFVKSSNVGIYTLLALLVIQQIEGNLIAPKITGDSVSMHPITVIILLIIGGELWGTLGMLIAVPIGVVIKVIYEDLNYYLF